MHCYCGRCSSFILAISWQLLWCLIYDSFLLKVQHFYFWYPPTASSVFNLWLFLTKNLLSGLTFTYHLHIYTTWCMRAPDILLLWRLLFILHNHNFWNSFSFFLVYIKVQFSFFQRFQVLFHLFHLYILTFWPNGLCLKFNFKSLPQLTILPVVRDHRKIQNKETSFSPHKYLKKL